MIRVLKIAGQHKAVVQFAPDDTLVFDVLELSEEQWQRLTAQGGIELEFAEMLRNDAAAQGAP